MERVAAPAGETPLIDLTKGTFTTNDTDAPPRRTRNARTTSPPKKRAPLPAWKDGVISAWATNLYTTAGKMVAAYDENYGVVLQGIAVPAGQAWENLAKDSPTLRRIIHSLMTTTKTSELIMAHMPLIILVMHKHGPVKQKIDELSDQLAEEMSSAG